MKLFEKSKKDIHEALCDNFNTPQLLKIVKELISKSYEYHTKAESNGTFKIYIIYSIGQFISHITRCLGLVYKTEFIDYFITETAGEQGSESYLTPYINLIAKFRDDVKNAAAVDKDLGKVLKTCDQLRDEELPQLGIKIEDKGKGNV
jgi:cysteinyl-tRNA synthetase